MKTNDSLALHYRTEKIGKILSLISMLAWEHTLTISVEHFAIPADPKEDLEVLYVARALSYRTIARGEHIHVWALGIDSNFCKALRIMKQADQGSPRSPLIKASGT